MYARGGDGPSGLRMDDSVGMSSPMVGGPQGLSGKENLCCTGSSCVDVSVHVRQRIMQRAQAVIITLT